MNIFPRTIEAELQTLELYAKARRCLQRVLSENLDFFPYLIFK